MNKLLEVKTAMHEREIERLIHGARELGVDLDAQAAASQIRLLDELERWNRAYNLTAVRERADMLVRHLLDSLSVAPYLSGERILDVGTGAGFPGLPLAIAKPALHFTLLDSSGKKIRFVEHAVRTLGLPQVSPVQARAEEYRPPQGFDVVLGRAFAPADRFVASCRHLLAAHGRLMMMKGQHRPEEWAGLQAHWSIDVRPLHVPGLDEQRHLITLIPRRDENGADENSAAEDRTDDRHAEE